MKHMPDTDQRLLHKAARSAATPHRAVVGHVVSIQGEAWIYDHACDPPAITAGAPAMSLYRANAIFGPGTRIQLQNGPEIIVAGSVLFR